MNKFMIIFMLISTYSSLSFSKEKLELKDLGFKQTDITANAESQKLLDTRSHKLQKHQVWGLATLGLMAATFLIADQAEEGPSEIYQYLGLATAAGYWTTFYYQYTAPKLKITGKEQGWNIRLHKKLAWIHAPLMILTPIAGILAWQAHKNGKEPSDFAENKATFGNLAMASFGLAATLMVIDF